MKAFIMINHVLSASQQNEFDEMGVTDVVTLSDDLKKVWNQKRLSRSIQGFEKSVPRQALP